ncbi:unnamed protein product [Amoebophrya sp. A25]|nr:unnamed protein product [Amoebophrya sp. A25]|eukprot:GSA25T00017902001.1
MNPLKRRPTSAPRMQILGEGEDPTEILDSLPLSGRPGSHKSTGSSSGGTRPDSSGNKHVGTKKPISKTVSLKVGGNAGSTSAVSQSGSRRASGAGPPSAVVALEKINHATFKINMHAQNNGDVVMAPVIHPNSGSPAGRAAAGGPIVVAGGPILLADESSIDNLLGEGRIPASSSSGPVVRKNAADDPNASSGGKNKAVVRGPSQQFIRRGSERVRAASGGSAALKEMLVGKKDGSAMSASGGTKNAIGVSVSSREKSKTYGGGTVNTASTAERSGSKITTEKKPTGVGGKTRGKPEQKTKPRDGKTSADDSDDASGTATGEANALIRGLLTGKYATGENGGGKHNFALALQDIDDVDGSPTAPPALLDDAEMDRMALRLQLQSESEKVVIDDTPYQAWLPEAKESLSAVSSIVDAHEATQKDRQLALELYVQELKMSGNLPEAFEDVADVAAEMGRGSTKNGSKSNSKETLPTFLTRCLEEDEDGEDGGGDVGGLRSTQLVPLGTSKSSTSKRERRERITFVSGNYSPEECELIEEGLNQIARLDDILQNMERREQKSTTELQCVRRQQSDTGETEKERKEAVAKLVEQGLLAADHADLGKRRVPGNNVAGSHQKGGGAGNSGSASRDPSSWAEESLEHFPLEASGSLVCWDRWNSSNAAESSESDQLSTAEDEVVDGQSRNAGGALVNNTFSSSSLLVAGGGHNKSGDKNSLEQMRIKRQQSSSKATTAGGSSSSSASSCSSSSSSSRRGSSHMNKMQRAAAAEAAMGGMNNQTSSRQSDSVASTPSRMRGGATGKRRNKTSIEGSPATGKAASAFTAAQEDLLEQLLIGNKAHPRALEYDGGDVDDGTTGREAVPDPTTSALVVANKSSSSSSIAVVKDNAYSSASLLPSADNDDALLKKKFKSLFDGAASPIEEPCSSAGDQFVPSPDTSPASKPRSFVDKTDMAKLASIDEGLKALKQAAESDTAQQKALAQLKAGLSTSGTSSMAMLGGGSSSSNAPVASITAGASVVLSTSTLAVSGGGGDPGATLASGWLQELHRIREMKNSPVNSPKAMFRKNNGGGDMNQQHPNKDSISSKLIDDLLYHQPGSGSGGGVDAEAERLAAGRGGSSTSSGAVKNNRWSENHPPLRAQREIGTSDEEEFAYFREIFFKRREEEVLEEGEKSPPRDKRRQRDVGGKSSSLEDVELEAEDQLSNSKAPILDHDCVSLDASPVRVPPAWLADGDHDGTGAVGTKPNNAANRQSSKSKRLHPPDPMATSSDVEEEDDIDAEIARVRSLLSASNPTGGPVGGGPGGGVSSSGSAAASASSGGSTTKSNSKTCSASASADTVGGGEDLSCEDAFLEEKLRALGLLATIQ